MAFQTALSSRKSLRGDDLIVGPHPVDFDELAAILLTFRTELVERAVCVAHWRAVVGDWYAD